jgi:subtilisin family serine protease
MGFKRRSLMSLLLASTVGATVAVTGWAASAATPAGTSARPADAAASFIVSLRPGVDPAPAAADLARSKGAAVGHVYRHALRGFSARLTPSALKAVSNDPRVAAVVPDRELHITAQTAPAGIARIGGTGSSAASGDGRGSVDVDIAVIDTGIDAGHRDLNVVGGVNCVTGNLSYNDLNGHGTHVAGTAAARDNKIGVVGVAPGARLWAVRVFDSNGNGLTSSVICGIDWVTAHAGTIEVANMSLGGPGGAGSCTDGGMREAICRSVAAGVTYVVSAGNSGSDAGGFVPARYPEVITVSAITDFDGEAGGFGPPTCAYGTDDAFAGFSNFGDAVDLTAPGVCVLSTWRGGGYRSISGTSMASPHVTGAAALYLSTHRGASPAAVKAALVGAGTLDWSGDPDGVQEPLVNVAGF